MTLYGKALGVSWLMECLGTSLGTPYTMIPPQLFQIMCYYTGLGQGILLELNPNILVRDEERMYEKEAVTVTLPWHRRRCSPDRPGQPPAAPWRSSRSRRAVSARWRRCCAPPRGTPPRPPGPPSPLPRRAHLNTEVKVYLVMLDQLGQLGNNNFKNCKILSSFMRQQVQTSNVL